MQVTRPKVTMVAAMSLDGRIAARPDQSSYEWTSAEDKEHFARVTKQVGVVVMGRRTFETFNSRLAGRRLIVVTSRPEQYQDRVIPEVLEFTDEEPADLVRRLEDEAVEELVVAGGASMYSQYMRAGVVDDLILTVEPIIFGTGVPLIETTEGEELDNLDLKLTGLERLNKDSVLLRYRIDRTDMTNRTDRSSDL